MPLTQSFPHHFRGEENVLVIDYVEQHIDTFLVIHTGIREINVFLLFINSSPQGR